MQGLQPASLSSSNVSYLLEKNWVPILAINNVAIEIQLLRCSGKNRNEWVIYPLVKYLQNFLLDFNCLLNQLGSSFANLLIKLIRTPPPV